MNTNALHALAVAATAIGYATAAHAGFLQFPLKGCANTQCSDTYDRHGAYAASAMNSVLDHAMRRNGSKYYPYGDRADGGGNVSITAFNGENVQGTWQSNDDTCVKGTIYLRPDWDRSRRMTNDSGCGSGWSSYDEHPGYDYYAAYGAPVYAAYSGTVLSGRCYVGNMGGTCYNWGAVGIKHDGAGSGYISQYLHMIPSSITVSAGDYVTVGKLIGKVGTTCYKCSIGAHLHFEVRSTRAISPEIYPIVDPYGWVGYGSDPLYSAIYTPPKNLWK